MSTMTRQMRANRNRQYAEELADHARYVDENLERAEKAYDETVRLEKDMSNEGLSDQRPYVPTTTDRTQEFAVQGQGYQARIDQIRALPRSILSKHKCENLRREIAERKKSFLDWISPDIERADKLHKSLTGKRKEIIGPYDALDDACAEVIADVDAQEKREEEERKAAEIERQRQEDAERKRVEVASLNKQAEDHAAAGNEVEAISLKASAQQVEAAPFIPTIPVSIPRMDTGGSTVIRKKQGTMTGKVTLLAYMLGVPEGTKLTPKNELIVSILDFKEGEINRIVNKGVELPGVTISWAKAQVRTKK